MFKHSITCYGNLYEYEIVHDRKGYMVPNKKENMVLLYEIVEKFGAGVHYVTDH